MKRWCAGLGLLCAVLVTTTAVADEAKPESGSMTMTMKPGAEPGELAKFFKGTATWKGNCPAGAMGPNSPAMSTKGEATFKEMLGGWWYVGDVSDEMGSGKDAMTWKGHMIVGWDGGAKAYKAYSADNMGSSASWTGTLDGDKFVLETDQPVMQMGQSMKDRLTWARNADGTINFTDEHQLAGSTDWTPFETGVGKLSGGGSKSSSKKSM
jgi:hypothetical protein